MSVKLDEKGDDKKLNLTFRMMLGVRVAIGRQASPFLKGDLVPDDFTQARIQECDRWMCVICTAAVSHGYKYNICMYVVH